MKKTALLLCACAAVTAACDCNSKSCTASETAPADTLTYTGEGPAADGTYEYTLSVWGDSIRETALLQVGVTPKGRDTVVAATGLLRVIEKDGKTYYRISEGGTDSATFRLTDNQTLRLVSDTFEEPIDTALATDLKLAR